MSSSRRLVHLGLPLLGLLLAFAGTLFLRSAGERLLAVALGVALLEMPRWKTTYRLLHNARRFRQLRGELEEFVWLVRELNAAALAARTDPAADGRFADLHTALQESLERMAIYAGRTDEELLREQAELQPG